MEKWIKIEVIILTYGKIVKTGWAVGLQALGTQQVNVPTTLILLCVHLSHQSSSSREINRMLSPMFYGVSWARIVPQLSGPIRGVSGFTGGLSRSFPKAGLGKGHVPNWLWWPRKTGSCPGPGSPIQWHLEALASAHFSWLHVNQR